MREQEPVLITWDHPNPFTLEHTVDESDIDMMGHTNNVVYLKWLEQISWAHSEHLGLGWPRYQSLQRMLVARRHELDYLASSFVGESVVVGTWIGENDGKLSIWRYFQVVRADDGKTLLRGKTHWVCVDTETGKPRRMPPEFVQGYQVTVQVEAAPSPKVK